MAERLILVGSGLAGLALFWLLGYLAHRQSGEWKPGLAGWVNAGVTAGAILVGYAVVGCLALITIGLTGLET